jgi:methylmalonyl-CoA mutase N-terminal domain/subunit
MEQKALELIKRIDDMGGAVIAIEQGFIQNEIARSAYQYQKAIESEEKIIVGVNKYQVKEERFTKLMKIDETIQQLQMDKLIQLKAERNNLLVASLLAKLEEVANSSENLMPTVIACVEAYCTLGEIADVLRKVYGEFKG